MGQNTKIEKCLRFLFIDYAFSQSRRYGQVVMCVCKKVIFKTKLFSPPESATDEPAPAVTPNIPRTRKKEKWYHVEVFVLSPTTRVMGKKIGGPPRKKRCRHLSVERR